MRPTTNHTGYILKIYPAKDVDQVVHLMQSNGTRQVFYAKGSRRAGSRKSHAIDLLNQVHIKSSSSKTDLAFMSEIKLHHSLRSDNGDISKLTVIQALCELFDAFTIDEEQPALYILLDSAVQVLSVSNDKLLLASVMLKLLDMQGALPELDKDPQTSADILHESERIAGTEIGYSKLIGGTSRTTISDRIYKSQRLMQSSPLVVATKLKLRDDELQTMFNLHLRWMQHFLEKELRGAQLLNSL